MNNKKYKTTMGTIAGLMVLSGGLFVYENVYKVHQEEANKTTIYVASHDIQAHTVIKADMFKPLEIENTSVLRGYVTDINGVVGKELKGGVLAGEPLTKQRLEEAESHKGDFLLKVVPDSFGDVGANDNVKIFVQLTNKDTGEVTMKELFANKKVEDDTKTNNGLATQATQATQTSKEDFNFNILANEKEVKDYYIAKASGSIIVVKLNELDTEKISSNSVGKFDAKSDEVKNATKKTNGNSKEGQAIVTYTVENGDTLDSLSLKFKTEPKTISALNDGKKEFKAGDMIQVPAN